MIRSFGSMLFGAAALLAVFIPHQVKADIWEVDYSQSRLTFEATQGGAPFVGEFRTFDAQINFDPDDLTTSEIRVTIDTASAVTGSADKDGTLPGSDWFATQTHPTATFATTSLRHLGEGRYEADGTLTIRDQTRPVKLTFDLQIEGDQASATGTAQLDRLDFGIGASIPDDATVSHAVTVSIDIKATRKN